MSWKDRHVIRTSDGSATVYVPDLNEHYHSIHGAVKESMHVFINHGLLYLPDTLPSLRIFEMGFGTGLNALLTFYNLYPPGKLVEYTAIDAFPLEGPILYELNYPEVLDYQDVQSIFMKMHQVPWGKMARIDRNFFLVKQNVSMENVVMDQCFDLVYYDAFSPDVQPECWEPGIFAGLYSHMAEGGVLVTYSAKGSVRRALQQSGFHVERLPGAPGKREMIRAVKEGS